MMREVDQAMDSIDQEADTHPSLKLALFSHKQLIVAD
jgi:hypothetical protein